MSIDYSKHSLFGASKAAADLLVQEYGRYFGMPTVSFRGGCLTGPAHAGTELHGFLSYLMIFTVSGRPYRVFVCHYRKVSGERPRICHIICSIWGNRPSRAFNPFTGTGPSPAAVMSVRQ
jgi:nucleoside-diphosphate-sugar epimerase